MFADCQVATGELIRRELAMTAIAVSNETHQAKEDRLAVFILAEHLIQILDPLLTEMKKLRKNNEIAKNIATASKACTICGNEFFDGQLARRRINYILIVTQDDK